MESFLSWSQRQVLAFPVLYCSSRLSTAGSRCPTLILYRRSKRRNMTRKECTDRDCSCRMGQRTRLFFPTLAAAYFFLLPLSSPVGTPFFLTLHFFTSSSTTSSFAASSSLSRTSTHTWVTSCRASSYTSSSFPTWFSRGGRSLSRLMRRRQRRTSTMVSPLLLSACSIDPFNQMYRALVCLRMKCRRSSEPFVS